MPTGREGKEVRVDGLHEKTAHHSQRDDQKRDAVAGRNRSAHLIFKTVADPYFMLSVGTGESCAREKDILKSKEWDSQMK